MTRSLFATKLYEAEIADEALLGELAHSIRSLAEDDVAGQRWSEEHRYAGYTSYASLNDLPRRDPVIADLAKLLTKHAAEFAQECAFDLARKPKLDSLWVNLLRGPGPSQRAHPPAQHHLRHALRRSPEGLRRDPLRGPSPADDDGRPDAPDRRSGRASSHS